MPDFSNPQDLNRYSYTRNSPLNFVDPTGHALEQSTGGSSGGLTDKQLAKLWELYNNSDWQENLSGTDFNDFTQASSLYNYYVDNPEGAWQASTASGGEANSLMWARQYSENVLHQAFLPIDDGILIAAMDKARETGDTITWAIAASAMIITEFYSSRGGSGGGTTKVLQTGGHTLNKDTLKQLGLTKQQGRDAIHGVKQTLGIRGDFHGKIMNNGDVIDPNTGMVLGNLYDHVR